MKTFSREYQTNDACTAYEAAYAVLVDEWTNRTDRTKEGEAKLREAHYARMMALRRERDEALARDGLYIAERYVGESNEELVELLSREESQVA